MGRTFSSEMTVLKDTYYESFNINPKEIKRFIFSNIKKPFFIVGSGGSFCVCETIALLIESIGGIAKAITPYEIRYSSNALDKSNIIFYSASGGNGDIIGAYKFCKKFNAKKTFIICLKRDSKIKKVATDIYLDNSFFECDLPYGKDGFLAFHSTLFVLGILQSIYCDFFNTSPYKWTDSIFAIKDLDIGKQSTFVALGSGWAMPVVKDFESKCTEAALTRVLYSDIRNFAHGRHHWLAKHPDTFILAFSTFSTNKLMEKTLNLIPVEIQRKVLLCDNYQGISCTIELYLKMCIIISELGKQTGIDPGKPGVPDFGSKIYHLKYPLYKKKSEKSSLSNDILSRMIRRKKGYIITKELELLAINSAKNYLQKLANQVFKGIIIDYDNTVIKSNNTSDSTYIKIVSYIEKYAKNGIVVCFSTGRGKSIKQQLCRIIDEGIRNMIYISYYNGAITIPLNSELPDFYNNAPDSLMNVYNELKTISLFETIKSSVRDTQITYELDNELIMEEMYNFITRRIMNGHFKGVKAEKTDHSIDIVLEQISKRNSVAFVQKQCKGSVLCIGDAGSEQGNDYELLNSEFSLSVSEVSSSLDNCWNIASQEFNGPEATLEYFSNIRVLKKGLVFKKDYLSYIK